MRRYSVEEIEEDDRKGVLHGSHDWMPVTVTSTMESVRLKGLTHHDAGYNPFTRRLIVAWCPQCDGWEDVRAKPVRYDEIRKRIIYGSD